MHIALYYHLTDFNAEGVAMPITSEASDIDPQGSISRVGSFSWCRQPHGHRLLNLFGPYSDITNEFF